MKQSGILCNYYILATDIELQLQSHQELTIILHFFQQRYWRKAVVSSHKGVFSQVYFFIYRIYLRIFYVLLFRSLMNWSFYQDEPDLFISNNLFYFQYVFIHIDITNSVFLYLQFTYYRFLILYTFNWNCLQIILKMHMQ